MRILAEHTDSGQCRAKMPQFEFDCHDFLCRLITPERWEESVDGVTAPTSESVKQQLLDSYDFVDIRQAQTHDSLVALGISREFLEIAVQGFNGFSEFFLKWASRQLAVPPIAREVSPRVVDAVVTLRTEHKHSISPWTGTIVPTRNSLGPNWHLFGDSGFITGQISALPFQTHDTIWIAPSIKKILFVPAGLERPEILDICARTIVLLSERICDAIAYLRSEDRKIMIHDFQCEHLGHYIWNVISAWGGFFEMVQPSEVETIACANPDNFFGAIKDVFSLHTHNVTEKAIRRVDEVYDLVFKEAYLLSAIHASYITEFAIRNVVRHSMERCDPAFKERLDALRREHWPLVLFSLRLDNRFWVDQIEGFAELAAQLRQDFPDIGFVIHGMSKGVSRGWTTAWMSLEAEIQAAAELECALGRPSDVVNAVGLSIHESVAISNLCDAFVAPVGSGMALYKWLTNKPGVAFSNKFCADAANPDRWIFTVFDGYRPNVIPATYVPVSAVTDLDLAHGARSRANFTLDRSVLSLTVRKLLLSLLNLALRKPAMQSSVSRYSIGRTSVEDAKGGNNGSLAGSYGFHTGTEQDPWWQVDLEDSFLLQRVVIFNRPDQPERLKHFTILGSPDGREWKPLFQKTDDQVFGRGGEPYTAKLAEEPLVRFVRVRLDGEAPLHFRECQVFGVPPDVQMRAFIERVKTLAEERRKYVAPGRRGRVVEIGGFAVFIDEKYDPSTIEALAHGEYRRTQRQLVGQLVTHKDRIIDVGTAIGVLAMTAARVVGAENVLTMEVDPDMMNDARDNFKRNGLEDIASQVGIVRNRKAMTIAYDSMINVQQGLWPTRLNASDTDGKNLKKVDVPILCLEEMIASHRATVLICDIEGGEVDLLSYANLSSIRLIILQVRYTTADEAAADEALQQLIRSGFSLHLRLSCRGLLVLQRHKLQS